MPTVTPRSRAMANTSRMPSTAEGRYTKLRDVDAIPHEETASSRSRGSGFAGRQTGCGKSGEEVVMLEGSRDIECGCSGIQLFHALKYRGRNPPNDRHDGTPDARNVDRSPAGLRSCH